MNRAIYIISDIIVMTHVEFRSASLGQGGELNMDLFFLTEVISVSPVKTLIIKG